jgi:hypothetical protein
LEGANGIYGPYPTKFSGHTGTMLISATAFSGGVTNAGTIGPGGGVVITSSTFLTGGFLNTNIISGAANGIGVLSDSTSPARSSTAARSAQLKTAF